jgi:hypothetical protein
MDLGTIQNQLKSGLIHSISDFSKKMRLVFTNCMKYNTKGSNLFQIARTQVQKFDSDIAYDLKERINLTIQTPGEDTFSPKRRTVLNFYETKILECVVFS